MPVVYLVDGELSYLQIVLAVSVDARVFSIEQSADVQNARFTRVTRINQNNHKEKNHTAVGIHAQAL